MAGENRPQVCCWESLPTDSPMPLLDRRRVIGIQAMISHVRLRKGCFVPSHRHENEQFACILSGALRFGFGHKGDGHYQEVIARQGDVVLLPSMALHSAEAIEDTIVLDVFSPPSEKTGIDRKS